MRAAALIVAAGSGQRLGGAVPKQYLPLGARPVIRHSIDTFLAAPEVGHLQVVIRSEDAGRYGDAVAGLDDPRLAAPVGGGASRSASVARGLEALEAHAPEAVLIHGAARPFVTARTIAACLGALARAPGALPALPVVDALWREGEGGAVGEPVARDRLWRAQTPQAFRFREILAA
jgi:2-C-methyl-D-erythritol 4-phosphate cytidylyltransferase/2-C-methyl-D-erythritol 2,4-cyclodiphosphate synthase